MKIVLITGKIYMIILNQTIIIRKVNINARRIKKTGKRV